MYQITKGGRFEMARYSEVTPWPVGAILDCHLKPCGIFITKFVNTKNYFFFLSVIVMS